MTYCATPNCIYSAGTRCGYSQCPGNQLRSTSSRRVERKGCGEPPASQPTLSIRQDHGVPYCTVVGIDARTSMAESRNGAGLS